MRTRVRSTGAFWLWACWTLCLFTRLSANFRFPSEELTALKTIYQTTSGDHWQWKLPYSVNGYPWNFSQPEPNPCTEVWQGIVCTTACVTAPCYTKEISLIGLGLIGVLPPSTSTWSAFTHLLTLQINSNPYLMGTIPSALSVLTSLQVLQLYQNALDGSLPLSIGLLTALQDLSVYDNQLSGTIPPTIGNLQPLTELILSKNNLTGNLTESICLLTSLTALEVNVNQLTGTIPSCLDRLRVLTDLDLSENQFNGTIPTSLTSLTSLRLLGLELNVLSGTLPNAIGNWVNLITLSVSNNKLIGSIPLSIGECVSLATVYLDYNLLDGPLPDSMTNLTSLKLFDACSNMLTGRIPEDIGQLSRLHSLSLCINKLTGPLPSSLTNLSSLTKLSLFNNSLSDRIPEDIGNLSQLLTLTLDFNKFYGTLPESLYTLSSLQYLDLHANFLGGSLSSSMDQWTSLTYLNIAMNLFKGTLPATFCYMSELKYLFLEANSFSGPLPKNINNLTKLVYLQASSNEFTGPIPTAITQLQHLHSVVLDSNNLNGTIPLAMGNMTSLSDWLTVSNQLTGSIPPSIIHCKRLRTLDFIKNRMTGKIPTDLFTALPLLSYVGGNENQLTGSLPATVFESSMLVYLFLGENFLTSTFPAQVANRSRLAQCVLGLNLFHGTLPETIGQLSELNYFYLMENAFEGALPMSMFNLTRIFALYLFQNQFTSSIAESSIHFKTLYQIDLHLNYLTGAIPRSLLTGHLLKYMYAFTNFLSGVIPFSSSLTPAVEILIHENFLTGSLSSDIAHYPFLLVLNVSTNDLIGSLPASMMALSRLEAVDISNNHFTGSLEHKVSGSFILRSFFAQNNSFSGRLDSIFDLSIQKQLKYLDLSDNRLSGSLPVDFFVTQNMTSIALIKNCFTGSIPEEICSNRMLVSLALDGLHTAKACQQRIFAFLPSYVIVNGITGTFPPCLLGMKLLKTLHLSGNGLQGTIPADVEISEKLLDLSLSHNQFVGSIPLSIQSHSWENLDLSFNRLNGHVSSELQTFVNDSSLTLQVNRLSGRLPSSVVNSDTVNVLNGNLFGCPLNSKKKDIPHNDPISRSYECGSNSIDVSMYLWAGVTTGAVILLTFLFAGRDMLRDEFAKMSIYWALFRGESAVNSLGNDLANFRQLCAGWTAIALFALMPLYVVFSAYFSTHESSYIWAVSFGFIGGRTPAIIAMVVLWILLLVVEYNMQIIYRRFIDKTSITKRLKSAALLQTDDSSETSADVATTGAPILSTTSESPEREMIADAKLQSLTARAVSERDIAMRWLSYSIATVVFDIIIVLAVNLSYVSSKSANFDIVASTMIAFALSIFKISWSFFFTSGIACDVIENTLHAWITRSKTIHRLQQYNAQSTSSPSSDALDQSIRTYERRASRLLIGLSLFNTVVAPCLAVMLISPSCFTYVIRQAPAVSVTYRFLQCSSFYETIEGLVCVKGLVSHTSSYLPAFDYTYQCTSSILFNFVYVYLMRYLLSGIGMPLMLTCLVRVRKVALRRYGAKSRAFVMLSLMLPPIRRIVNNESISIGKTQAVSEKHDLGGIDRSKNDEVDPKQEHEDDEESREDSTSTSETMSWPTGLTSSMSSSSVVRNPLSSLSSRASVQSSLQSQSSHEQTNNSIEEATTAIARVEVPMPAQAERVFLGRRYSTILVGDLAILLTFGTMFPPLSVAILLCIVLSTVDMQLAIGRFVVLARQSSVQELMQRFVPYVLQESAVIGQLLALSISPISILATIFWSFFLFDALGDKEGTSSAYWILFVLPSTLIAFRMLALAYDRMEERQRRPDRQDSVTEEERNRAMLGQSMHLKLFGLSATASKKTTFEMSSFSPSNASNVSDASIETATGESNNPHAE